MPRCLWIGAIRSLCRYRALVTLTDFLVARCLETLESVSCSYERREDGFVTCECDAPDDAVRLAVERANLVRWCDSLGPGGDRFMRMLADAHATHPDYQPEWHRFQ